MKKRLFVLLCIGVLLTGCAEQKDAGQEEAEIISLDLGGNIQNDDAGREQADNASEAIQPVQNQESQVQEAESILEDNIENAPNEGEKQDLYMRFINNEVSAVIGDDYPENDYRIFNLERGRAYTFAELGQYVNQSYFDPEYSEKTSYDYAQYAYVECPDSDSRNLLIKFVGLNIYTQGDDSFAVYVLTEANGQLYLTAEYECWARSYTEQYRNGLCSNSGSGGAGDHYSGISAILSDGSITNIYGAETLSGWWASYVSDDVYREVFDENTEVPLNVTIYTIGGDKYYTYDFSECTDDQLALCETYINRCRDEAGINWAADEAVQEAVKKRCSSLGVNYDMIDQQEETEWIRL